MPLTISDSTFTRKPSVIVSGVPLARSWKKASCRRDVRNCGDGPRSGRNPWRGAMEATLFSGWIYDTLKPCGEQLGDGASRQDEIHQRR